MYKQSEHKQSGHKQSDHKQIIGKSAKRVFETSDLVWLIYSFGDPRHRRLVRRMSKEIQSNPNEFLEQFIIRKMQENEEERFGFTVFDYMDELPQQTLYRHLKTFKRCYCCQRHNRNKPMMHNGRLVTYNGVVTENKTLACGCTCRHYSRFIIQHVFR